MSMPSEDPAIAAVAQAVCGLEHGVGVDACPDCYHTAIVALLAAGPYLMRSTRAPVAYAVTERGEPGGLVGYVRSEQHAARLVSMLEAIDREDGYELADRYQVTPVLVRRPHRLLRRRQQQA